MFLFALAICVVLADQTPRLPKPVTPKTSEPGKTCTVVPLGDNKDDVTQILDAFSECNNGGTVVFPEGKTYNIASRLNPVMYDVTVEWHGVWLVLESIAAYRSWSDPVTSSLTTSATGETALIPSPFRTMLQVS
jgi:galacturan 1,4-alpha-galacturonidase